MFKFRFENALSYQRCIDAVSKNCVLTRYRDIFAFDYQKKISEYSTENNALNGINDNDVLELIRKEYTRMLVEEERVRFKKFDLPDKTRIRRRMDLPSEVYVPKSLLED